MIQEKIRIYEEFKTKSNKINRDLTQEVADLNQFVDELKKKTAQEIKDKENEVNQALRELQRKE